MKRIVLVATLAALAGCQQQERAPAPEATAAAAPGAEVLAADGKSPVGKMQITTHDGKVFTEEVKADGTYVQSDSTGKVVETGRWVQKSPTQYCYTSDGEGSKEECNTEGVDAAGKWTSTNAKGETATVVRVES
jgi:hypothetical protein